VPKGLDLVTFLYCHKYFQCVCHYYVFSRNAYSGLFHNRHIFHTLLKLCLTLLKLNSSPHKATSTEIHAHWHFALFM